MGFERCHPAVNLIYFTAVIGGTVCFRHPVYLAISLCSAFLYSVKRKGRRAVAFGLCLVPLVVALGLFYSSYHHFGVTNLRQNFIGNQITLESLVYGLALGCTLAGVAMWMSCVYAVFSADQGGVSSGLATPELSLCYPAASSAGTGNVGAGPRKIHVAQQGIGRGLRQGNILRRLTNGLRILFHTHHLDGGGPGCRIRIHAEPGQWTKRTYRLFHLPV